MAAQSEDLRAPGDARPRPFDHCYWLLPGRMLAGEHPGARGEALLTERLQALHSVGVTTFVDLTTPRDSLPLYAPRAARRLSFPIADFDVPSTALLRAALEAMDRALEEAEVVYLHCRAGIGRTGAVAGCWLVEQGLEPAEALTLLQRKYQAALQSRSARFTPETLSQHALIASWQPARRPPAKAP
jgi:hypothetical protein